VLIQGNNGSANGRLQGWPDATPGRIPSVGRGARLPLRPGRVSIHAYFSLRSAYHTLIGSVIIAATRPIAGDRTSAGLGSVVAWQTDALLEFVQPPPGNRQAAL
jgi:hypothetical protein